MLHRSFSFFILLLFFSCANNDQKTTETVAVKKDTVAHADTLPLQEQMVTLDTTQMVTDTAGAKTIQPIMLQFNLQKGKHYQYIMEVQQEMMPRNIKNSMVTGFTLQVMSDDGKVKDIRATYDKVVMKTTIGTQQIEISSEKPAEGSTPFGQLSKVFAAVKGKSFTMKVRKDGEILDVQGFDKIGEAMVAEMDVPADAKQRMLQNFKEQFNNQTVKHMFAQSFNIYPSKPVKPGDKWERKVTAANGQFISTTYTLRSIKGNEATITASSKLDISEFKAKGSQNTVLQVDTRNGLVRKGQFEQKIEGQMKIRSLGVVYAKEL
jgi:hypothetical protein